VADKLQARKVGTRKVSQESIPVVAMVGERQSTRSKLVCALGTTYGEWSSYGSRTDKKPINVKAFLSPAAP